ncbi:acetate/propionate family kinase [Saccharibacillus sp. JS10]|uniref:acetate/propionate family kinase n=1 Tax=Saccharibacillus sp. JS10 TaxID=2950552 RepID=UPI00210AEC4F|nr:acetate kinase [Saccharibacillus sp. JS10]MCQ4085760.1 acetate kinase [Saccharibacillus sp. JS10]
MKVLVINSGSSSLKYQLYDMTDESVLAKGLVERIGMDSSILTHKPTGKDEVVEVSEILEHNTAIRKVIDKLTDGVHGVLSSVDEINAVGHRVVHGGEFFNESALVDKEAKKNIRALIDLAPLHNPAAVMGIEASEINMPGVPQVVVFDTAFHQTMPEKSYLYAIPRVLYSKYKVRRYGFHGTSHYYVSLAAAEFLNKPIEDLKMITAHIGNGGSLTAIQGGVSVDTSMGMTPLEGLMMGTRSGDLDPAIVPYVMNKEELSVSEVNSMLNKHSGLLAISGVSSDMRDITDGWEKGDANATLAFEMYEYRLRKYIGSYAAAMNGVDVLIFTAGVGENSAIVRKVVCENLSYLGIEIDEELNKIRSGDARRISTPNSKVEVLVVPTNEELVIARDTFRIVEENKA